MNFNQSQFKVGDLVRLKDRDNDSKWNNRVGMVTKTIGCYSGFVEIMIGTWKGSVNWRNLEVIK